VVPPYRQTLGFKSTNEPQRFDPIIMRIAQKNVGNIDLSLRRELLPFPWLLILSHMPLALWAALCSAFERLGEGRAPGRMKEALAAGAGSFGRLLDELSGLAKRRGAGRVPGGMFEIASCRSNQARLARIDATTSAPTRRVTRLDEIPEGSRSIVKRLVDDARLLVADRRSGVDVVEVAHESLLRQWPTLRAWLDADAADLKVVEGVERAADEWLCNGRLNPWLDHRDDRLSAAEKVTVREDFRRRLGEEGIAYLSACRKAESGKRHKRRRVQATIYTLFVGIIIGLIGWINESTVVKQWRWWAADRPFMEANVWPFTLKQETEQALKRGDSFRECAPRQKEKDYCPDMVVVPAGEFTMGSPPNEADREDDEGPQHKVLFEKIFAVSKFEVTFEEWDVCVNHGDCEPGVSDSGWGRGQRPVISVTWNDAQRYVKWFSKMTGKPYRLLSESEWEYAARAGTQKAYAWGDSIDKDHAHCRDCGSHLAEKQTAPVGSFASNAFGIFDMEGNVWEWVEDCYHENYSGAPIDGSPWTEPGCVLHVTRGGAWQDLPEFSRAASRWWTALDYRNHDTGFRIGRTLNP
jgi:formylglycine-generating enzyme required for sulfatase activity